MQRMPVWIQRRQGKKAPFCRLRLGGPHPTKPQDVAKLVELAAAALTRFLPWKPGSWRPKNPVSKAETGLLVAVLPIHDGAVLGIVEFTVAPIMPDLVGQRVLVEFDTEPRACWQVQVP